MLLNHPAQNYLFQLILQLQKMMWSKQELFKKNGEEIQVNIQFIFILLVNPEIVSSSTMIDYLYVTVDGATKNLDESSFKLEFDDHFFADSNLSIESKKNNKKTQQYSVEVKYR